MKLRNSAFIIVINVAVALPTTTSVVTYIITKDSKLCTLTRDIASGYEKLVRA